ncbi:hypothetical protein BST97_03290 [Nonlabens spongiae]|uniref:Uncharacterized protein n=1 Tax=Nonlabens spongiae TaxID=331648 RepID=A0A1W6MHM3_9FLAO|nr:hypothetical protein BST97_03290 [Nonlabens spongiae]
MELHLQIIGFILIALAGIHVFFARYFNWKQELRYLSLINRQMMIVHTFFLALVLFLVGLLCLTSSNEMVSTRLGNKVCLGLGTFWIIRLMFQFFVYSPLLWKGKRFETMVHIIFIALWTYLTIIFLWIGKPVIFM